MPLLMYFWQFLEINYILEEIYFIIINDDSTNLIRWIILNIFYPTGFGMYSKEYDIVRSRGVTSCTVVHIGRFYWD